MNSIEGFSGLSEMPPKTSPNPEMSQRRGQDLLFTSTDLELTDGPLSVHNVMIYLQDGGIKWDGGEMHLDAPDDGAYAGLLFYVDPQDYVDVGNKGNQTVTINRNIDSEVEGTIFAPSADCKINGTSDTGSFRSQTICYTVKLTGGDFYVTYDPDENYQQVSPPNMEVKK